MTQIHFGEVFSVPAQLERGQVIPVHVWHEAPRLQNYCFWMKMDGVSRQYVPLGSYDIGIGRFVIVSTRLASKSKMNAMSNSPSLKI